MSLIYNQFLFYGCIFFLISGGTSNRPPSEAPLDSEKSKGLMSALYAVFEVYKSQLGGFQPPNWKEMGDGSQGLTPTQIWNHGFLVYKAFFVVANEQGYYCKEGFRSAIKAAIQKYNTEAAKYIDANHLPLRTTWARELQNIAIDCSN